MPAAERAKSVKTKAVVNESPTDKLIRELREENKRLMEQLAKGGGGGGGAGANEQGEFGVAWMHGFSLECRTTGESQF